MNHQLLYYFVPQGGALVVYQIVVFVLTKHEEATTLRKLDVLSFFSFFNRYDWYQTESQVIITLMIKNVQKNNISVEFSEKEVIIVFELFFVLRLNTFICKIIYCRITYSSLSDMSFLPDMWKILMKI